MSVSELFILWQRALTRAFMAENKVAYLERRLADIHEASPYEFEWMERHNREVEALHSEIEQLRMGV